MDFVALKLQEWGFPSLIEIFQGKFNYFYENNIPSRDAPNIRYLFGQV